MTGRTILVVEDNVLNLELLHDILSAAGHTVLSAKDAHTAITTAHREHPDLILMDIQLPDMNGLEAVRLLKSNPDTCKITIVAVTSHAMKGDREKAEQAGCTGYFVKPINARTFAQEIEMYFN